MQSNWLPFDLQNSIYRVLRKYLVVKALPATHNEKIIGEFAMLNDDVIP